MIKKLISILIIFGFLVPSFSFAQGSPQLAPPETIEKLKEMLQRATEVVQGVLPGTLEKTWKEEVLPIWQKMWDWFKKTFWDPYIAPFFEKEVEKRKPIVKKEFQKEKEEMKQELPEVIKSLWDKLKELIK